MIAKAFLYTTFVILALYIFTDAPVARGGETSKPAFETCKTLDYVGSDEDGSFDNFQTKADDLTEANYEMNLSSCGRDAGRNVNMIDPAGKLNEAYDFFTGQKEVRID
jgi:hypothetical protein